MKNTKDFMLEIYGKLEEVKAVMEITSMMRDALEGKTEMRYIENVCSVLSLCACEIERIQDSIDMKCSEIK